MSLRYRDSSGNETIVSGLTPGGDIEAGAVDTRSGFFSTTAISAGNWGYYDITFDAPLPDNDYVVEIYGTGENLPYNIFSVENKKADGFRVTVTNTSNITITRTNVAYKAYKVYTVQHAAQNAEDIANIKAVIPSAASSTNQLTPKKYVDDADTALDERVSDLEDLVPTGADVTNQLTTKSYVDEAITHVEIDVDDALDDDSENPVQNKVVKAAIDAKQDEVFVGTVAEWEELTPTEQNKYQLVNLTDDGETGIEQNYSATEVKTGEKWIDGKDIYKLTFSMTNPKVSSGALCVVTINMAAYNIDTIIRWDSVATWQNRNGADIEYYFPIAVTVLASNYTRMYYNKINKLMYNEKNSAYYDIYSVTYNTIYYTKA